MNQDLRRMAEEFQLPEIDHRRWTEDEIAFTKKYAREAIAAALVKLTQGQEAVAWIDAENLPIPAGHSCLAYAGPGPLNFNRVALTARLQPSADAKAAPVHVEPLTVWFDKMPESSGKRNWTVMLRRKNSEGLWGSIANGLCFERTEYYDRARYQADRLRFLIGELDKEPDIMNYDPDMLCPEEAAHGIGKDQS